MVNAKDEILREIGDKEVELVRLVFGWPYGEEPQQVIEGQLPEVLQRLDFRYDNGFGGGICMDIFGTRMALGRSVGSMMDQSGGITKLDRL